MAAPHGKFTLSDFQKQMRQIKKLGSVSSIMKMIPGMGEFVDLTADMKSDKDTQQIDGIINSMTHWERDNPEAIDENRRNRIARGSGAEPADVSKLLDDFLKMAPIMEKMGSARWHGLRLSWDRRNPPYGEPPALN